jgi:hypothetical protein
VAFGEDLRMIVSLDELKRVIGIALTDTSEDDNLTRLITAKTVAVQGMTHRRFDSPELTTEYQQGPGTDTLFLAGYVDDSADDNPSETTDFTVVHVWRRPIAEKFRDWEELVEGEDWERRGSTLLFLRAWGRWERHDEFKITYFDGFVDAPEDIKEVIIEMALNQYMLDVSTSAGEQGLSSETLGDFSWSKDLSAVSTGTGALSDVSTKTIKRYKRQLV